MACAPKLNLCALKMPVTIGSLFDECRVCRLGGWTRHRLSYIVMVAREIRSDDE